MTNVPLRRILVSAGKIGISCALLAVIAAKINFAVIAAEWRSLDAPIIATSLLALLAEISVIAGVRLKLVLDVIGTRRPVGKLLQVVMSGFFFEQVAFGFLGGDSMRFLQMRRFDVSTKHALGAIVIDRALGMVSLLALALLGLPGLVRIVSSLGPQVIEFAGAIVLVFAIAVASVFFTRISEWFVRNVYSELTNLWSRLQADRQLRGRVCGAIGLAFLTQLLNVLVFALIGRAFHLDIAPLDWLFIVPPVLLVSMIPLSAGGWGLREASLIVILGDRGIPADSAVIPSLIFGIFLILVTLPGGFLWLANRGTARKAAFGAVRHPLDAR